jgi:hypothetical protein
MDIDFPLVLTWAVLICGGVWLFDVLALRPRRRQAAVSLEASGGSIEQIDQTLREPRLVEYARSFFPVLLVVLVLRSFLAEPYQIPSESMIPTLEVGDFVLVNKYAYGLRLPVLGTKVLDIGEPQRGDVMVSYRPMIRAISSNASLACPGTTFVTRTRRCSSMVNAPDTSSSASSKSFCRRWVTWCRCVNTPRLWMAAATRSITIPCAIPYRNGGWGKAVIS